MAIGTDAPPITAPSNRPVRGLIALVILALVVGAVGGFGIARKATPRPTPALPPFNRSLSVQASCEQRPDPAGFAGMQWVATLTVNWHSGWRNQDFLQSWVSAVGVSAPKDEWYWQPALAPPFQHGFSEPYEKSPTGRSGASWVADAYRAKGIQTDPSSPAWNLIAPGHAIGTAVDLMTDFDTAPSGTYTLVYVHLEHGTPNPHGRTYPFEVAYFDRDGSMLERVVQATC